jgi:HK97 gp10 family phage protein
MPVVTGYQVVGANAVIRALARLSDAAAEQTLVVAAQAAGIVVQTEWKSLFRSQSDASYPGSLPRRQTGQYAQSIHVEIVEHDRTHAWVAIGPSIIDPPYPLFLEYGTSKMPAHPIARPAWDRSKARALKEMADVLKLKLGL